MPLKDAAELIAEVSAEPSLERKARRVFATDGAISPADLETLVAHWRAQRAAWGEKRKDA